MQRYNIVGGGCVDHFSEGRQKSNEYLTDIRPDVNEKEAMKLAKRLYGIESAEIRSLESFVDRIFLIKPISKYEVFSKPKRLFQYAICHHLSLPTNFWVKKWTKSKTKHVTYERSFNFKSSVIVGHGAGRS